MTFLRKNRAALLTKKLFLFNKKISKFLSKTVKIISNQNKRNKTNKGNKNFLTFILMKSQF
jgi:hypothetical protein